ncbi:MAG: hypothetical protein K9W44_12805 [Candidatus Lokiarchaeota archaeon]|nr:hypothetical protein [Candidatus Harpocratesius repetitus]
MQFQKPEIKWQFINVSEFTPEHLKHFSLSDIRKMFLRVKDPMVPELAYLSFLQHSMWGVEFDIERGIQKVLMQLRLPLFNGQGLSWRQTFINPHMVWATEDSLDYDTYEMLKAGIPYMIQTQKPIPPVIVWLIKDDSRYNYVCHDGHHRVKYFAQYGGKMPTILVEYWIDNRDSPLLSKKLPYMKIDKYVKDLPIIQRDF